MTRAILLGAVLLIGVVAGATVVPQYFGGDPPADVVCNQQLDGNDWNANLNVSEDLQNGTRLVCERNGTQRTLTVDVSIDVGPGGDR
ncbi:hypothetical protein [Halobacterium sp. CBA1126]|uniref:hypothetical protein n=1 Tax=Halobacterium sp. CBA1126 TaxID=2668074 RepID=UPI0012F78701|nr:hypothetical protein [Halobacterium sp. CBA1126]MUV59774.1 hypothetical protein [Halobacterium sp. CBA1126]